MKVAFFVDTKMYGPNTNYCNLENGNPGIGGTEYMMLLICSKMALDFPEFDVTLYTTQNGLYDIKNVVIVKSIQDAMTHADKIGAVRFVFDHKKYKWFAPNSIRLNSCLKLIPWCHIFALPEECQAMAKHPNIGRIVTVGKEQQDLFRDDKSFNITDYIYNCVPLSKQREIQARMFPNKDRNHIVTYVGSIVPTKSFHVLAKLWPQIISLVPDAQLYIIGGGSLYGRIDLGKYGISSQHYEDTFMKYLTLSDGSILPSVHFMGVMGENKNDILLKTKVGIPNPIGKTETFCLSAVEMQSMGCSVTAIKAPGYFDTIYNGFISNNEKELLMNIVKLLKGNCPHSYDETIKFIKKNFSIETICFQWKILLSSDLSHHIHLIYPVKNIFYRFKWLKEIIRVSKIIFPFLHKFRFTVEGHIQRNIKNRLN